MPEQSPPFLLVGGDLAVDFVNTVAYRLAPELERELLHTVDDLRNWAEQAGMTGSLSRDWRKKLSGEARLLKDARAAREILHDCFLAASRKERLRRAAADQLNRVLRRCPSRDRLEIGPAGLAWDWPLNATATGQILRCVMEASVKLFDEVGASRLRRCDGPGCGWLFVDRSPAGRRRWCSMADCGNRAKAHRHQQRKRADPNHHLQEEPGNGG